jgi:hypothetical protein
MQDANACLSEKGNGCASTGPEDINLCFETPTESHVVGADREPAFRLLEKIEAAANLHGPVIVDANLPIVQIGIELDLEKNVSVHQALLELFQLVAYARQVGLVVVTRNQVDTANGRSGFDHVSQKRTKFVI